MRQPFYLIPLSLLAACVDESGEVPSLQRLESQAPVLSQHDRELPSAPPLPEAQTSLNSVPSVTARFSVTSPISKGEATTTLVRSESRVYWMMPGGRQEWLFTRNPIDPRRIHGQLVDHNNEVILDYMEADLLDAGVARTWSDVATGGMSPTLLDRMAVTGSHSEEYGYTFVEYADPQPAARFHRVFWSGDLGLALSAKKRIGDVVLEQRLVALDLKVSEELLSNPRTRFPDYPRMDVVDWREEHHGHPEHPHQGEGFQHGH